MKLEQMYSNFMEMTPSERMEFYEKYSEKRRKDMEKPPTYGRKKAASTGLSPSEKAIAKELGLTAKEIKLLKELG